MRGGEVAVEQPNIAFNAYAKRGDVISLILNGVGPLCAG